jgi:hypothetical protein
MSAPRILYAEPDLRGIDEAARQLLLWPCHMFTVALPKRQQRVLNVFEETVLRLAAFGYTDAATLAALTCLEPEMVTAILRRLVSLRFLDAAYRPVRDGGSQSGGVDESWENVRVFIDLIGGRLLPCMSYGTPEYAECLDSDGTKFRYGDRNFKAVRLEHGREFHDKAPTPREVHAVARIRIRQDSRRPVADPGAPAAPSANAITIMGGVDKVYLATTAVLQAGNHDDVLLMDPFGLGACGTLAEVFHQARTRHASIRRAAEALLADASVAGRRRAGGVTKRPVGPYPEVAGKIWEAGEALGKARAEVRDSESAASAERAAGRCLRALYDAVELALHAVVIERPPSAGLRALLASQSFAMNGELFWSYAVKLGLRGEERERRLLQVAPGKFQERGNAGVELAPLLALALSVACAERDASHPLRAVAEAHPDGLGFLLQLKGYRDRVAHGKSVREVHADALEAYHARACNVIGLLLPGWRSASEAIAGVDGERAEWRNQARLQARIAAGAALAPASLEHLPDGLRKLCIELELLRERAPGHDPSAAIAATDEPDLAGIVDTLAALLQLALEECLGAHAAPAPSGVNWGVLALQKARIAGFELQAGNLPEALSRVAQRRLAAALRGGGATLQSATMALVISADEAYLNDLAGKMPRLLTLAGDIAALRGHGHLTRAVTLAELETLRKQVYQSILYLTEI